MCIFKENLISTMSMLDELIYVTLENLEVLFIQTI